MIETLPLLTFMFGVFTGCLVSLIIGGIWVKRKLDSMKQSGGNAINDMMSEMMGNMPDPGEMADELEQESDEK